MRAATAASFFSHPLTTRCEIRKRFETPPTGTPWATKARHAERMAAEYPLGWRLGGVTGGSGSGLSVGPVSESEGCKVSSVSGGRYDLRGRRPQRYSSGGATSSSCSGSD